MEAIKSTSAHGKNASPDQIEELNLITPMSSMNTSPTDQEVMSFFPVIPSSGSFCKLFQGLINVTAAKVTFNGEEFAKNAALNETVSTEAFSSPKSLNLVTSSPHVSVPDVDAFDRDSNLFGVSKTMRPCAYFNGLMVNVFIAIAFKYGTFVHRQGITLDQIECDQKLDTRFAWWFPDESLHCTAPIVQLTGLC